MKKSFKRKNLLAAPQHDPGVAGLINKLQQQLSAMEKKLDILISQSSKKPFEKNYSQKPSQRFNHSHRHDRGRQGNGSRERTYTRVICADCNKECEIPFKPSGDRPVYCKECFSKRKTGNLFNADRDNRTEARDFPREHRSNKMQAEKRQKPVKKKKSFFARRKKRA
ncbi:MAG: CxxC-x17-CxxC domain-containing protein [Candidatus Omnitrophota bacterium]